MIRFLGAVAKEARRTAAGSEGRDGVGRLGFQGNPQILGDGAEASKEKGTVLPERDLKSGVPPHLEKPSALRRGIQNVIKEEHVLPQPSKGIQPRHGSAAINRSILPFNSDKQLKKTLAGYNEFEEQEYNLDKFTNAIKMAADAVTSIEDEKSLYPNLVTFIMLFNFIYKADAAVLLIQKVKKSLNPAQLTLLNEEFNRQAETDEQFGRLEKAEFLRDCARILKNLPESPSV
jgi:hypothetical protein